MSENFHQWKNCKILHFDCNKWIFHGKWNLFRSLGKEYFTSCPLAQWFFKDVFLIEIWTDLWNQLWNENFPHNDGNQDNNQKVSNLTFGWQKLFFQTLPAHFDLSLNDCYNFCCCKCENYWVWWRFLSIWIKMLIQWWQKLVWRKKFRNYVLKIWTLFLINQFQIIHMHTATAEVWKVYLKLGKFSKKFREIDVALNFSLFLATLDFLKNIFGAFRHMETYIIWIKIL